MHLCPLSVPVKTARTRSVPRGRARKDASDSAAREKSCTDMARGRETGRFLPGSATKIKNTHKTAHIGLGIRIYRVPGTSRKITASKPVIKHDKILIITL